MTCRRFVLFLAITLPGAALIIAGMWVALNRASSTC